MHQGRRVGRALSKLGNKLKQSFVKESKTVSTPLNIELRQTNFDQEIYHHPNLVFLEDQVSSDIATGPEKSQPYLIGDGNIEPPDTTVRDLLASINTAGTGAEGSKSLNQGPNTPVTVLQSFGELHLHCPVQLEDITGSKESSMEASRSFVPFDVGSRVQSNASYCTDVAEWLRNIPLKEGASRDTTAPASPIATVDSEEASKDTPGTSVSSNASSRRRISKRRGSQLHKEQFWVEVEGEDPLCCFLLAVKFREAQLFQAMAEDDRMYCDLIDKKNEDLDAQEEDFEETLAAAEKNHVNVIRDLENKYTMTINSQRKAFEKQLRSLKKEVNRKTAEINQINEEVEQERIAKERELKEVTKELHTIDDAFQLEVRERRRLQAIYEPRTQNYENQPQITGHGLSLFQSSPGCQQPDAADDWHSWTVPYEDEIAKKDTIIIRMKDEAHQSATDLVTEQEAHAISRVEAKAKVSGLRAQITDLTHSLAVVSKSRMNNVRWIENACTVLETKVYAHEVKDILADRHFSAEADWTLLQNILRSRYNTIASARADLGEKEKECVQLEARIDRLEEETVVLKQENSQMRVSNEGWKWNYEIADEQIKEQCQNTAQQHEHMVLKNAELKALLDGETQEFLALRDKETRKLEEEKQALAKELEETKANRDEWKLAYEEEVGKEDDADGEPRCKVMQNPKPHPSRIGTDGKTWEERRLEGVEPEGMQYEEEEKEAAADGESLPKEVDTGFGSWATF
ncbi:uncharacterized protein KY384_003923 [Bacidia gigantensis]|uniref:uncharacterized protein n=1 Tax=Bacidia gigantensis TaxID=2732470 RepID=UPI001D049A1E|nr:uncharacterized protein KY384_003923 [Bacidia gigantensis]KAG8532282.1 hypothetical protein KY384_003923 [Bacidia gigantensis]